MCPFLDPIGVTKVTERSVKQPLFRYISHIMQKERSKALSRSSRLLSLEFGCGNFGRYALSETCNKSIYIYICMYIPIWVANSHATLFMNIIIYWWCLWYQQTTNIVCSFSHRHAYLIRFHRVSLRRNYEVCRHVSGILAFLFFFFFNRKNYYSGEFFNKNSWCVSFEMI